MSASFPLRIGPGPSPVSDRVLGAMACPALGHPDHFLEILDDVGARPADRRRRRAGTSTSTSSPDTLVRSASIHQPAPINRIYALHETLVELEEEGLDARYGRHREAGTRLQDEVRDRGFRSFTDPDHRLPELTAVHLPADRDEAPLRRALLDRHGIEVGGRLGPARGRIWRIGLMGHGARLSSVDRPLEAVDELVEAAA